MKIGEFEMFWLKNITKCFRSASDEIIHVLNNVTFDIPQGQITSIIGPSGCGKTTLLRIIAGFEQDYEGEILYRKNDSEDFIPFHPLGNVGYVPQEYSVFPWLTVEKNIEFGLHLRNIAKEEKTRITSELLELVKLTDFKGYYPKEISGGMKQKVAICRAIAINPVSNLILMDEPFSSLDSQTRNKLQSDLVEIWQKQGLTIVFVTHNIDEAVYLSDKIHVMSPIPSKIIRSVEIDLPRPRDRTESSFNRIRRDLLLLLGGN